ncbi:hypothetical protein H0H92_003726 [Tricholoma furcatifolium]|nr:hypothetical protein H0H92_003726 [Tricholoma furcatifolium]
MERALAVLKAMGIEVKKEHQFRYHCTRPGRNRNEDEDCLDNSSSSVSGAFAGDAAKASKEKSSSSNPHRPSSEPLSPSSAFKPSSPPSLVPEVSSTGSHVHLELETSQRRDTHQPHRNRALSLTSCPSSKSLSTLSTSDAASLIYAPGNPNSIFYGSPGNDSGGQVVFAVELTHLPLLKATYSLDIRRLKGSLRNYKFLYNTVREYVAFSSA